ncbi:sulfate adenylyltransferase subunit CysN [Campylobacter coli]|uniref:sulfate adenylyltransferase subunit CysN n=1 Tax=Campylobacter coli TaxID=195 RepID=UPI00004B3B50|nr:sulfate adenylyltransferase subunit CysN [Campylobacter coli]EAH4770000.1 sulfate adenylyltransferase subunit CysN [Campylobacter coli]EAH5763886.1 sulfate adenylyltransferase subunit CysN [Campylobacter coli]EAH6493011.1 sulfate adenylyltransferase subunit CysN [Campylobacter coli]EAH6560616.1 sulfate adenylyltransferase subunit CysN [Campylobacter coli]EAH6567266.1 sulfate adenylyltransferase subunit CysN [Campylobacter coli]
MQTNIEKYLQEHENKELCRFITCGSVDDGKSTLIGRMLYDSKMLFEDQILSLKKDSKKLGNAGEKLDFALLVDGLASEREQGITIDVAYRFFTSEKRKFIIADTPGHEQYTRNMATGASTADIAIILIDARKGVLTQTKRHSYIVSLLGIKQFIIAINKMDLVDFRQDVFDDICKSYKEILPYLKNYENIQTHFVPISALDGDNIASKSIHTPWYNGKTLSELLDTLSIVSDFNDEFIMSVQYVNRPHLNFRGFCGSIASGKVSVGDEIMILPSLKTSKIKEIITPDIKNLKALDKNEKHQSSKNASFPSAITLTLEDEIDISRGDVIASKNHSLEISNSFKAMMIWMSEAKFSLSGNYLIKIANLTTSITFEKIDFKKDINTFEESQSDELKLNDIAKCTLKLSKKTALAAYKDNKTLGSFIIIDRYSNETLAAGMVEEILTHEDKARVYTQAEIELNAYIRKNYPEWECKKI